MNDAVVREFRDAPNPTHQINPYIETDENGRMFVRYMNWLNPLVRYPLSMAEDGGRIVIVDEAGRSIRDRSHLSRMILPNDIPFVVVRGYPLDHQRARTESYGWRTRSGENRS